MRHRCSCCPLIHHGRHIPVSEVLKQVIIQLVHKLLVGWGLVRLRRAYLLSQLNLQIRIDIQWVMRNHLFYIKLFRGISLRSRCLIPNSSSTSPCPTRYHLFGWSDLLWLVVPPRYAEIDAEGEEDKEEEGTGTDSEKYVQVQSEDSRLIRNWCS